MKLPAEIQDVTPEHLHVTANTLISYALPCVTSHHNCVISLKKQDPLVSVLDPCQFDPSCI